MTLAKKSHQNLSSFHSNKYLNLIKTGCSLIDFDVIFPMQSSEFTKSQNFGSV